MDKRTKVVGTAVSAKEYEVLRRMAYEKSKTISTLIRDILCGVEERPSFLPDATKMMVNTASRKADRKYRDTNPHEIPPFAEKKVAGRIK